MPSNSHLRILASALFGVGENDVTEEMIQTVLSGGVLPQPIHLKAANRLSEHDRAKEEIRRKSRNRRDKIAKKSRPKNRRR